jgi:hypothetical protein
VSSKVLCLDESDGRWYADVLSRCQPEKSTVQSLVLAALHGERGLVTPPRLERRLAPQGSCVRLTERMHTLFVFDMARVVKDNRYLAELELSMNPDDVDEYIMSWREARV